jgi:hypothetical protein
MDAVDVLPLVREVYVWATYLDKVGIEGARCFSKRKKKRKKG